MMNQDNPKPYLFQSAEIRWFLPPTIDGEYVLNWFLGIENIKSNNVFEERLLKHLPNNIKKEDLRTDEYLVIPLCTAVGIKKRQGKLEVKAQIGIEETSKNESVEGKLNYWSKWSFQPSESIKNSMKDDLDLCGDWLKINKIRYLLKLARSKDGIIEISPEEWPESGCQVELTEIWKEGETQKWTTFGFEAFGGSFEDLKENLIDAILFFLSKRKKPVILFSQENSMSYPEWVLKLL
jgi:hypothetical protein